MKKIAALVLAMGLTMRTYAEPQMTDIVSFEAHVIDEATSATLATGGPWPWEDQSSQTMTGDMGGAGRTIVVKCRNAAGATIFGGLITHADLRVIAPPMGLPGPSTVVSLTFSIESDTIDVFMNGWNFIGNMLILPAEDDVPPPTPVVVDIKPGSATNPYNVGTKGVLPVAVMGSADVNLRQIDPASVKLAGVSPVRLTVADLQRDGFADLILHFRDQDVDTLLVGVMNKEVVDLELTGTLKDGTAIKGTDSMTVLRKRGQK